MQCGMSEGVREGSLTATDELLIRGTMAKNMRSEGGRATSHMIQSLMRARCDAIMTNHLGPRGLLYPTNFALYSRIGMR